MNSLNITAADVVASASFVLAAFALLATGLAVTAAVWATYQARRHEAEIARIELSYRLLLAASGGGDARLPNNNTHYSSGPVQLMAIAALQSFPEFEPVYEQLLDARKTESENDPTAYPKAYYAATQRLVEEVARIKKRRRYRRPG